MELQPLCFRLKRKNRKVTEPHHELRIPTVENLMTIKAWFCQLNDDLKYLCRKVMVNFKLIRKKRLGQLWHKAACPQSVSSNISEVIMDDIRRCGVPYNNGFYDAKRPISSMQQQVHDQMTD